MSAARIVTECYAIGFSERCALLDMAYLRKFLLQNKKLPENLAR